MSHFPYVAMYFKVIDFKIASEAPCPSLAFAVWPSGAGSTSFCTTWGRWRSCIRSWLWSPRPGLYLAGRPRNEWVQIEDGRIDQIHSWDWKNDKPIGGREKQIRKVYYDRDKYCRILIIAATAKTWIQFKQIDVIFGLKETLFSTLNPTAATTKSTSKRFLPNCNRSPSIWVKATLIKMRIAIYSTAHASCID